MDTAVLRDGLMYFLIAASCICLRTWAQAWVANHRGDPGPRMEGRLTLNPLAHFDEIGTGLIPLLNLVLSHAGAPPLLGWGKPLALAYPNPKSRARHEMAIVSGGLAMNLLLALGFGLLGGVAPSVGLHRVCEAGIWVNAGLFVFHLLPIPPLDGAVFFKHLSGISDEAFVAYSQWAFWVFFITINLTPLGKIVQAMILLVGAPFYALM